MKMLNLTPENFEEDVIKSKKPIIVDFWAQWCGPCRAMAPVFEEIAGEMTEIKFAKVNVDENQKLTQQWQVMSIPTLILFKDGKEVTRLTGYIGKEALKSKIGEALS